MSRRIQIPVAILEFDENGKTIWVQSPEAATVLRIKTKGIKITVCEENPVSHVDLVTDEEITICLGPDASYEG